MSPQSVIIAGAGPVGLVTALGLARQGIPVTIIERESDVFRAPRAMGYHWAALYGLDDLGLLPDLEDAGFRAHGITFHLWQTGERLHFATDPLTDRVKHPYTLTLGQDRFAEIAVRHLSRHPHVTIEWGTTISAVRQGGDHVEIETEHDGRTMSRTADWLIASDGAASTIRAGQGIGFDGTTWPEQFVATNVLFDFSTIGFSDNNYLIDPDLGAVIAKITQDGLWRVTWAEDAQMPSEGLPARTTAYLQSILPSGSEFEVTGQSHYRMHQRAAETMRRGRVILAGDSAHATNPTSGFGLVGGLHDSYVLVDALGAVIRGEASDSVLDQYSEDRLAAFWNVSSPVSSESKRFVFHSEQRDRLEEDMKIFRQIAGDQEALTAFWLQGRKIETPSVVTGSMLSRGRNELSYGLEGEKVPVS